MGTFSLALTTVKSLTDKPWFGPTIEDALNRHKEELREELIESEQEELQARKVARSEEIAEQRDKAAKELERVRQALASDKEERDCLAKEIGEKRRVADEVQQQLLKIEGLNCDALLGLQDVSEVLQPSGGGRRGGYHLEHLDHAIAGHDMAVFFTASDVLLANLKQCMAKSGLPEGEEDNNAGFLKKLAAIPRSQWTDADRQRIMSLRADSTYREPLFDIIMGQLESDELKRFFNNQNRARLDQIDHKVTADLLRAGINPAGPKSSAGEDWHKLFDFNSAQAKSRSELGDARCDNLLTIRDEHKLERIKTLFSSRCMSFEALGLGYVAPICQPDDPAFYQLVCSTVRILGEMKRISGLSSLYSREGFPRIVGMTMGRVYGTHRVEEIKEELKRFMRAQGIMNKDQTELTGGRPFLCES